MKLIYIYICRTFQLEPGESKDIFMPIVPTIVQGEIEFTVDAFCFMERDSVTKKVRIMVSSYIMPMS
jgi:hypothetical protein